jgi:hypothetical protein
VLQTANIIQTYTTGAVPGSFAVTVPLAVERPLLFYPFDAYAADLVRRRGAEIVHSFSLAAFIAPQLSNILPGCLPGT